MRAMLPTVFSFGLFCGKTIRRKLLMIIMAVCSAALLLLSVLLVMFLMSMYRHRLIDELVSSARIIAFNCSAAVQFDDSMDAGNVLSAMSVRPTIAYASISRTDGTILASYQREGFHDTPQPAPGMGKQRRDKQWMLVTEPVAVNNHVVGSVLLQSDLSEVARFQHYLIKIAVIILILVLLAAYMLSARLQRFISGPVEHLTGIANQVSGTQDYALRATIMSNDESGILARAFNAMLSEVEKRDSALRHAQNYIENIINSMPSVLIGVDAVGMITQWNDEATRMYGMSREQAVGTPFAKVIPQISATMIKQAIDSRKKQFLQRQIKDKNGNTRIEDLTVFPLIANGVEGTVIRIDDITERSLLEEQLNQTLKMEAIGQLAGGVAHDFNNMLGGIMGGAELLEDWIPDEEEPRRWLNMIRTAADRAADLARQLLVFGRKQQKRSTPVDIHSIITDTVTILQNTIDKRITVNLNLNADHSCVVGDPSLLQNVFLNLGINASHAMPEGGTISFASSVVLLDAVYCKSSAFNLNMGKHIELTVRDTGCGMSPEIQKHIFEPFFTTKAQGKGTGLGLSAAYGTILQHNGEIHVYSEEGVSTCFRIILPLSEDDTDHALDNEIRHAGSGLILVVDDELIMRATAKAYLEECGYAVLLAQDGEEAIEIYKQRAEEIDLVICDMVMPRMNGRDCFKRIREINAKVPFVLSSGFSREEDLDQMKANGLSGFIHKPYRGSALSAIAAKAIRNATGDETRVE